LLSPKRMKDRHGVAEMAEEIIKLILDYIMSGVKGRVWTASFHQACASSRTLLNYSVRFYIQDIGITVLRCTLVSDQMPEHRFIPTLHFC